MVGDSTEVLVASEIYPHVTDWDDLRAEIVRLLEVRLDGTPAHQAAHVSTCATCGRGAVHYELNMDPKPAPPGPTYCSAHKPP